MQPNMVSHCLRSVRHIPGHEARYAAPVLSLGETVLISIQRVRTGLTGLALAGAAALAACTTPPPPPVPAPPPATPPAISLSDTVIQDAAVYQAYMARAAAINPDFKSGADVARALGQGDSISAEQLLRGEVAYAAIAALQDPNFVANVRAFSVDPTGRQQMSARLLSDPDYVVAFKGSDTAAGLAMAAITVQGRKLFYAGAAVKQAAYDVQHQDWSKAVVEGRPERLASAKSAALLDALSSTDDVARLRAAADGQSQIPLHGAAAQPPYPPVIVRGLAVAALAALGEGGDENLVAMAPLMKDGPTETCLHTAKLNLYQCLAVARPHYEDIFCLGQHVMMDTGQCVMIAAGAPQPVVLSAPSPPPPAAKSGKPAKPVRRRHHA
jgi:hypothetical protein